MKFFSIFALAFSVLVSPYASAATKSVKPVEVDYSDVTGPKFEKVEIDKSSLNLKSKSMVVKIIVTVSDDLNSIGDVGVYFSRLDSNGKVTGPKLMVSKPKPSIRTSSKVIDGRRIEVFEMSSTFPKGLAAGQYKLLTGDFRDLASNRRQDLSAVNSASVLLPIISVQ